MTSGGNLNPANADLGGWMGRMRWRGFMPTASSTPNPTTKPRSTQARVGLNATVPPDITFRSTSINGQSGTFTVKGDLTITGTTRPISLAVAVGGDGQVTVRTSVVQTQFGIKPYSAMLGTLKNSDEVEVRATLTLPTY
jgi:polyisoprenoid-binding protein YceI